MLVTSSSTFFCAVFIVPSNAFHIPTPSAAIIKTPMAREITPSPRSSRVRDRFLEDVVGISFEVPPRRVQVGIFIVELPFR